MAALMPSTVGFADQRFGKLKTPGNAQPTLQETVAIDRFVIADTHFPARFTRTHLVLWPELLLSNPKRGETMQPEGCPK